MKEISHPKVLFTTGLPRAFRASNIAYLYEIAQVYPVVLLSEKLDPETEEILHNKELFPLLEAIIPYQQFTGKNVKADLFSPLKNIYYYKLAKNIINRYKPDIIIVGDQYLFQLYLLRFARRIKSVLQIAIQGGISGKVNETDLWSSLLNFYSKPLFFLPLRIKLFFTKCKRYLAHIYYYWILPLMVGQLPFVGNSSFLLYKGDACKSSDAFLVYSERELNLALENGAPVENLYILSHPLLRKKTRAFFEKVFFVKSKRLYKGGQKIVTIMYPSEEMGFKKEDHSLIPKKEMKEMRLENVSLITNILKNWKVFIKPHPSVFDIGKLKKLFLSISPNITVVNSSEPAEKYIEISDVIIGFPPASTTLFTASLQCSEKPILSLDLHHELLGDYYKDFEGIDYVDSKEKFIGILKEIQDNKFHKKGYKTRAKLKPNEFSSFIEALEYFLQKKH